MVNLTKAAQFCVNGLLSHELFSFESEHGLVREEGHQLVSGPIEGRVEVVDEGGTNLSEISHI